MTEASDNHTLLAVLEERLNALDRRVDTEIARINEKFADVKDAVELANSQYPTQKEVAEKLEQLRSAGVERRDLDALTRKVDETFASVEKRLAASTQAAALARVSQAQVQVDH